MEHGIFGLGGEDEGLRVAPLEQSRHGTDAGGAEARGPSVDVASAFGERVELADVGVIHFDVEVELLVLKELVELLEGHVGGGVDFVANAADVRVLDGGVEEDVADPAAEVYEDRAALELAAGVYMLEHRGRRLLGDLGVHLRDLLLVAAWRRCLGPGGDGAMRHVGGDGLVLQDVDSFLTHALVEHAQGFLDAASWLVQLAPLHERLV